MSQQEPKLQVEGVPLVVCVFDCQLDQGQPKEELAQVCFRVNCAFAERRWGTPETVIRQLPVFIS